MEKTMEYRKLMLAFKVSALRYVVVNAFLAFVNWSTSPHYWWVLWVIAGWGIGLALRMISQYAEFELKTK